MIMQFLGTAVFSFFLFLIGVPIFLFFVRLVGLYAVVEERTCRVYMLFGRVIGILNEPGLQILPLKLGINAFLVHWLGKCHVCLLYTSDAADE